MDSSKIIHSSVKHRPFRRNISALCVWGSFFFLFSLIIPIYAAGCIVYHLFAPLYLSSPLLGSQNHLRIRNDSMGEGGYEARRSGGRKHAGLDFLAPEHSAVVSVLPGRVIFAGVSGGYGKLVSVLHPNGFVTRYAHLSQISTRRGAWVNQGQRIGRIGRSGNAESRSIRPHLHFELRFSDSPINPSPFFDSGKVRIHNPRTRAA